MGLGLSLSEIDELPARDRSLWLVAAHRMAGRTTIALAQAIGIAFAGKEGEQAIKDLLPDYSIALGDSSIALDEEPSPEEYAAFFGLQIVEMDGE